MDDTAEIEVLAVCSSDLGRQDLFFLYNPHILVMLINDNMVGPVREGPPRIAVLLWRATATLVLAILGLTFYEMVRIC